MKVVVIGASGGIGRLVVGQLLAEGHGVTAVVRRPAGLRAEAGLRIALVPDLSDVSALAESMTGSDAVISAVGPRDYRDLSRMEASLAASGLVWTAMRPPRLSDGPLTNRHRLQLGGSVAGGFIVSRADVAAAMCAALEDSTTFGKPVGIAY